MAGDVDVAAARDQIRVGRGMCGSRSVGTEVLRTADADLAEVVPAGPGEVPDDMAMLFDQPLVAVDAGGKASVPRMIRLGNRSRSML